MPEAQRILIHNDRTATFASQLRAAFPDSEIAECTTYEALPAQLEAFRPDVVYTVRFAGTPGYPREALFAPTGPRWITNGGAGTDHFGRWDPERTIVTNAAGVAADMMAEYVMGTFLHFTLDIPGFQSDKAQKIWQKRMVRPLKGSTLVILGLGHTGRAIAQRAKAFGITVIGTRTHPKPMENVDEVHGSNALQDIFPRADFIAVSTPLTATTRGLLDKNAFSAMKSGVILADVSRGGVIDQQALLWAMDEGIITCAALDVFETEPLPADSPFWQMENTIISPHCSSVYDGWAEASFDLFLTNLERWNRGEELFNIVDPARGY